MLKMSDDCPDFRGYSVFIDCGASYGYLTGTFIRQNPNFKKAYLFEIIAERLAIAKTMLPMDKCIFVNSALFDEKRTVTVTDREGLDSNCISTDANYMLSGEKVIEATTLDIELLGDTDLIGERIFVNVDCEGSDLATVVGAKRFIKKYKPTLCISIYHKDTDKDVIPVAVREMFGDIYDYKIITQSGEMKLLCLH